MPPTVSSASRWQTGLAILLQAFEFAKTTKSKAWDFAVELPVLYSAGMSGNELRFLLASRFMEHGIDLAPSDTERRHVRVTQSFRFQDDSCFILTTAGVEHARTAAGHSAPPEPGKHDHQQTEASPKFARPGKPHWDRSTRRLSFEGSACAALIRAAENLEAVLDAFEAADWPLQIRDPFPAGKSGNRKRRLHNTINALNRCQPAPRIHFASADSGRAIRWTLIPPATTPTTPRIVETPTKRNNNPTKRKKTKQQKPRRKRRSAVHRNL